MAPIFVRVKNSKREGVRRYPDDNPTVSCVLDLCVKSLLVVVGQMERFWLMPNFGVVLKVLLYLALSTNGAAHTSQGQRPWF